MFSAGRGRGGAAGHEGGAGQLLLEDSLQPRVILHSNRVSAGGGCQERLRNLDPVAQPRLEVQGGSQDEGEKCLCLCAYSCSILSVTQA